MLYFYISGIIITPLVLMILPADFFDKGDSICLSVRLFDLTCLGCGMTRGIMHLVHLNFDLAWQYNKLSFIVLPLLLVLGSLEIKKAVNQIKLLNSTKTT